MNLGGYQFPEGYRPEGVSYWVPATPNTATSSRENPVPIQLQGTDFVSSNWQQLLNEQAFGSMNSYQSSQDLDPYQQVGTNGVHNFNPRSFMALLGVDNSYGLEGLLVDHNQEINRAPQGYPSMHGNFRNGIDNLGSNSTVLNYPWMASTFVAQNEIPQLSQVVTHNSYIQPVNRPFIPNLNVQAGDDWTENHSATMWVGNKNLQLVSSACTASKDVFQSPEDHFPVPSREEYNPDATAITEPEPSFKYTLDHFQRASATINQATKAQDNKQCEESNRNLSLAGDKQISLTENDMQQSCELLQLNADTSSCIISTPEKIAGNEKEGGQVTELGKTPQRKTPKRRKHRPKVIREGKPKKAPKSETPKTSKLPEKPKRKYTRKSSLNAMGSQPSDLIDETGGPTDERATNSCRRTLSFEQQTTADLTEEISYTQPEVTHRMSRVRFDLNLDNQTTDICTPDETVLLSDNLVQTSRQNNWLPFICPEQVINKFAYSVPQGPTINEPHLVRARSPPTRTTTFQDLLMGNHNSSGGMTTFGNENPNHNSQVQAMYSTGTYMEDAQLNVQHRETEMQTLYQHANNVGNLNNLIPRQRNNVNSHSTRNPSTQVNTFQELLIGSQSSAQVCASSQIIGVNQHDCRPYAPVQRYTSASNTGQLVLQTRSSINNLGEYGHMILDRSNHPMRIKSDGVQGEAKRSKRDRDFISEQQQFRRNATVNSSLSSRMMEERYSDGYAAHQNLLEAEKRRRIENLLYLEMPRTQNQNFAENKSGQLLRNQENHAPANITPSHYNPYPCVSYGANISHSSQYSRGVGVGNGNSTSLAAISHPSKQHTSSVQTSNISNIPNQGNLTYVRASALLVPTSDQNLQSIPARTLVVASQQSIENSSSTVMAKQYSRPTPSGLQVKTVRTPAPPSDKQPITTVMTNGSSKNVAAKSFVTSRRKVNGYRPSSSIKRGLLRQKDIKGALDDIVHQMEHLTLEDVSTDLKNQPQNAIVLYKGDGPVVMYQAKKRKPRPKVNLDAESERIWKLLMGIEGPTEGTDADKEKWWEQERHVFKLRADAFISRMHMVQGDRRFSKWKGSVVDSVIGVFLTQNVSDHLSSSAFMSLAARFPLSLSSQASCTDNDPIVEEPDICIIDLEDTTTDGDIKEALYHSDFVASQNKGKCMTSGTEIINLGDDKIRVGNNEIISVDAFDFFVCSTNRGSSSESKSEVEEQRSTRGPSNIYTTEKPMDNSQVSSRDDSLESPERSSHHPGKSQNAPTKERPQLSSGGSTSSCPTCEASEYSSDISDLELHKGNNYKQNGQSREKTVARPNLNEQLGSPVVHQQSMPYSIPCKGVTDHLGSLTFQSDKTSTIEEVKEISDAIQGQGLSTAANINSKGSSTKMRKGKQDADKKAVNWDELRKDAQCKIRRSKNKDAMDSMDYETMRHAEVKEISDAIKERGMNNMLAERIKAFLNRLVDDHGSIDLEWLRDAPPDKVKDYLLSIRGLGLKSVECVRLLTLHHLAFPVDTNVGRIAVRLGWVPLQPLPESLQLHLLEMYPVLETIQKYLWPRLCKLDQPTLYELHYQLITFGKVFCTKSKPNCNACPMRAECRHFASAFASARLALPAPEERNIVPSSISNHSDRSPAVKTSSQTLLEWDDKSFRLARTKETNCEPIIEEPKTPEPEPEVVSEVDIEDSFGEDPNEIPTMKLDVQQLTHTVQSFMHDNNMDVQEVELSKALVALTAEAASMAPQKLKNVSRLRTEHQVYELPDSHPLLKEMDRREPDDPSPYLLAIWSPGETAISTELPESRCQSDDPCKMCSDHACFKCNSKREANSNIVRGTLLIPCRTAMRGSFPLNGTYFQVNEVFADHESSMNPIDVPREWIWDLPRRFVYFGTSVSTIFKGLTTDGIQFCFWRGFVCVRGFDQRYRAPRPLLARLHHPASKVVKNHGNRRNGRAVPEQE